MGLADTSAARPGNGYRSATHPADPQPLPHNESAAHKPSQHPHSCRKTLIFLVTLQQGGWHLGDDVSSGPLRHVWQQATTMTFLGIVACQIGTAMASRTQHASLLQVGIFTNRLLLWGIAYEIVFAAALATVAPLQGVFGTATPDPWQVLLIMPFPVLVWGADELWRWNTRRRIARCTTNGSARG